MNRICYTRWESPVGKLLLAADERGLRQVHFPPTRRTGLPLSDWREDRSPLEETIRQLAAYFQGELREFDLPLSLAGTEFQLQVWRKLREIPYGEIVSYGELARQLGNSKGARAVGLANGSNPIPIIVPCHRVIGGNGSLVGYGGGLSIKRRLLSLEAPQRCLRLD